MHIPDTVMPTQRSDIHIDFYFMCWLEHVRTNHCGSKSDYEIDMSNLLLK